MHKIFQALSRVPGPAQSPVQNSTQSSVLSSILDSILGQVLVLSVFAALVLFPEHSAASYRIASWNIADFHHQSGVEARENIGTVRYPLDFKLLREYADRLDADIIALQEIVTEQAARLLFPANRYWLFMSSRYQEHVNLGAEPDIYTALAIRKNAGIQPVKQTDLSELQITSPGPLRTTRSTRKGTAVLLNIQGRMIWVMSVHLKSSCARVKKLSRSRQTACKMLWQQARVLKRWIDQRKEQGSDFIIAGDFNRRFGRLKNQGGMWKLLSQSGSAQDPIARFPQTKLRHCPTRKGKGVHPIDWFVVNIEFAQQFVAASYYETRWTYAEVQKHRNRLSDHCPIHIDFTLQKS